jgi:hypothetical protein
VLSKLNPPDERHDSDIFVHENGCDFSVKKNSCMESTRRRIYKFPNASGANNSLVLKVKSLFYFWCVQYLRFMILSHFGGTQWANWSFLMVFPGLPCLAEE